MDRHRMRMNKYRASFLYLGLVLALPVAGCRGDGPAGARGASPARAALDEGADCVDFQGSTHCPLGAAKLTPSDDGTGLAVSPLAAADKDGVSILLPDVTEFSASGRFDGQGDGSTLFARSINEGVSTSTMTVRSTTGGYAVSATFTGSQGASTYNVNLYNAGVLVGTIPGGGNGGGGPALRPVKCTYPPPRCLRAAYPTPPPPFKVIQSGHNAGACVWGLPFGADHAVQATLNDGKVVAADLVELEEVVQGAGSYPYLTFNRIDYTSDGGSLLLGGETIR